MERFQVGRPQRRALDKLQARGGDAFDPLTGLAGRQMFHDRAQEQWDRMARAHRPLSLLLVGIDRFQGYREQRGDSSADKALQAVSALIASACRRRADFAGRVRDHEFGVLLSETTLDEAVRMAGELRRGVPELPLGLSLDEQPDRVTASVGVASVWPTQNRFVETLVIAADQALKEAYGKGGNTVAEWRGF